MTTSCASVFYMNLFFQFYISAFLLLSGEYPLPSIVGENESIFLLGNEKKNSIFDKEASPPEFP